MKLKVAHSKMYFMWSRVPFGTIKMYFMCHSAPYTKRGDETSSRYLHRLERDFFCLLVPDVGPPPLVSGRPQFAMEKKRLGTQLAPRRLGG